jgi:uridylate kinase
LYERRPVSDQVKYKRVLVKLSGGALAGEEGFGFDHKSLAHLVTELLSLVDLRLELRG